MLKKFMPSRTNATHPQETPNPAQPANTPHASLAAAPEAPALAMKTTPQDEGNKLIVGPNIKLKGSEITDCEILVVEGRVEASMKSRHIRIAQGGVFCGKAEIDVAEIRGHFEGELIARKRLVIYATGSVTGQIHYGSMTVEEGGIISGSIEALAPATGSSKAPELATATPLEPIPSTVTRLEPAYSTSLLTRHMANKRQG